MRNQRWRCRIPVAATFLCFALPLAVYVRTLCPTVYTYDSAELASGVYTLGIIHAPGYPLYLLLGKAFTLLVPIGNLAYRLNLMSAIFAALSVVVVFRLALKLTAQVLPALAAALLYAFSFYLWQSALIAEVYTLEVFLAGSLILLAIRWGETRDQKLLYLIAFLYGLSLGNRMSGCVVGLGLAVYVLSVDAKQLLRGRLLSGLAAAGLIGLLVYLYLPWRAGANSPLNYVRDYYGVDLSTPAGLLWMMTGQMYKFYMFGYRPDQLPAQLIDYASWLWRNFAGIGVPVGLLGAVVCLRRNRPAFGMLATIFVANVLFFVNYAVMDKDTMFLPSYFVWTVWLAMGYSAVGGWAAKVARVHVSARASNLLSRSMLAASISVGALALVLNFAWVDQSHNRTSDVFAEQVFSTVESNSAVFAGWHAAVVLEYFQIVDGWRPDVTVINRSRLEVASFYKSWVRGMTPSASLQAIADGEARLLADIVPNRPLYTIGTDQVLASYFDFEPVRGGICYRLHKKPGPLAMEMLPNARM